jgi:hypothetical protein
MDLRKRDRPIDGTMATQDSPNPVDRQKPKNDGTPEDSATKDAEMVTDSQSSTAHNLSGAFANSDDPTWFTWHKPSNSWHLGNPLPATELWLDLPSRATECMPFDTDEFSSSPVIATLTRTIQQWSLPKDDPYAFAHAWSAQIEQTRTRTNKSQKEFFKLWLVVLP